MTITCPKCNEENERDYMDGWHIVICLFCGHEWEECFKDREDYYDGQVREEA